MLRDHWDFEDESVAVTWTPSNELDFLWWSDVHHLFQGVSLEIPHPDLLFWSDTSDQRWEANLFSDFVSGRWSIEKHDFSINLCELRAICLGLYHFRHSLRGLTVGVLSDNTTALSYRTSKNRGTFSQALNHEAQLLPLGGIV